MRRWLFGIDTTEDAIQGDLRIEWMSSPSGDQALLLTLCLLGAVVLVWLLYRWEATRVRLPGRVVLAALRLAAILATVAMLMEPVAVLSKSIKVPSHLLVLVDDSKSMDLRDSFRDKATADEIKTSLQLNVTDDLAQMSRRDLIRQLFASGLQTRLAHNGDREVHVHPFAERMDPATLRTANKEKVNKEEVNKQAGQLVSSLSGKNTAIGSSLHQSMMAYRGMPLSGILLISDGQSNAGESTDRVAQLAKEKGIPIQALAIGTARGPSNVSVLKLDTNPIAFIKDTNNVSVSIQSRGLAGSSATVIMEKRRDSQEWSEVGRQDVELNDDGSIEELSFAYEEEKAGRVDIRVRVECSERELSLDDNLDQTQVQLIPQQLRTLFIAGSTFPEVQFIRNTLLLDKGVELSTWNQSAEADYDHPGDNPIRRLPASREELNEYDCVILYDPDPAKWPSNFAELLNDFVSLSGGGLIYIAGEMQTERSFLNQTAPEMSWLSLLPVVRDPGLFRSEVKMELSARNAWRLLITPAGSRSHVMQFAAETLQNQQVLESLPGMFWHFPITRAKAGATVLARHGDPRMRNEFGPEVLLATHRVGPGRVYFVGFDSTYRWRYVNEQTFDGFWARMVDRAGRAKQLGGGYPFRIRTDQLLYEPGDQVRVSARMIDDSALETDIQTIQIEVEHGDNPPAQMTLEPGSRDGEFDATLPVETPGPYMIRAWAGERGTDSKVKMITEQIRVEPPSAEYDKPTLDRARLDAVASATGGRVFALNEIDRLVDSFTIGKVEKLIEDRSEVWNAPILFGLILLVMTTEWILRKRLQLV